MWSNSDHVNCFDSIFQLLMMSSSNLLRITIYMLILWFIWTKNATHEQIYADSAFFDFSKACYKVWVYHNMLSNKLSNVLLPVYVSKHPQPLLLSLSLSLSLSLPVQCRAIRLTAVHASCTLLLSTINYVLCICKLSQPSETLVCLLWTNTSSTLWSPKWTADDTTGNWL